MARLISLNQTTALVSSSSCNKSWTPRSVDTWKTPLRLDLTAAHSIVAPFKSTHNSGLLVPVDDPAAVVDIFALDISENRNVIGITELKNKAKYLRGFFEEEEEQICQDHPRGSPIFSDFLAVLRQFGFV